MKRWYFLSGQWPWFTFILKKAYQLEFLKIPLSLLAAIGLAYASTLDLSLKPLLPALKSNWLVIHVSSYCLSYGALLISFISSAMYLFSLKKNILPDG